MSEAERKVPKLRFPGFTEDWEQRKLGEIVKVYDNLRVPIAESDRILGNTPYYGANGIQGYIDGYTHNGEFILIAEDGANDLENYPIRYVSGKVWVNNHAHVVSGLEDTISTKFLGYSLKRSDIKSYIVGGSRSKLNLSDMLKVEVSYPKLGEQTQIHRIMDKIDAIITLHQRKLENLKLKKKALLQKLFPKNGEQFPELRFPGFTDAWEQRKLGEISEKVLEKNQNMQYRETFTNSAELGIISQIDFFDKEISNKENISGYYVVRENDFIYNPRISNLAPVGPINRNKLNKTGVMSPLYTIFNVKNIDLDFLENFFQSKHWHKYMKLNGDSGARADRIAIKDAVFFEMPILIPKNIQEQILIGKTINNFNKYITLHQRKLEHLQLQKKALLQQMFV